VHSTLSFRKKRRYNTRCIFRGIIRDAIITGDLKISGGSALVKELLKDLILVDFFGVRKDVENHRF
jgi:hypothetical protein